MGLGVGIGVGLGVGKGVGLGVWPQLPVPQSSITQESESSQHSSPHAASSSSRRQKCFTGIDPDVPPKEPESSNRKFPPKKT